MVDRAGRAHKIYCMTARFTQPLYVVGTDGRLFPTPEGMAYYRSEVLRLRKCGWSQTRIADEVGLTQSSVSRILSQAYQEAAQEMANNAEPDESTVRPMRETKAVRRSVAEAKRLRAQRALQAAEAELAELENAHT